MIPQNKPDALTWILTVTATETHRWVSEDVVITRDGARIGAAFGLELDDIIEGPNVRASVVAFEVPDTVANVGAWLRALSFGDAEIAIAPVYAGVARWEDRLVLRYGRAEDVEYDPRERTASLSLLGNELEDTGDLCPVEATVDDATWPLAPESGRGRRYPFVFGAPGSYVYPTWTDNSGVTVIDYDVDGWATGLDLHVISTSYTSGATPALPVDINTETVEIAPGITIPDPWPRWLLIADGWVDDEVTSVELWASADTGNGWIVSSDGVVKRGYDGLGRRVTLLKIKDLPSVYRTAGKWWVGWSGGAASNGALGQLTLEVLRRATCKIDWPAVRRAAQYLDRYRIGGFCSDSITPTAWVKNRTEKAGVIARWTTAGFSLVVTDPDWSQPPVDRIVVGVGAEVSGPIRFSPAQSDEVVVQWTGEGAAETAKRKVTSTVQRVAEGRPVVGDRRTEISAPECWDAATAIGLAQVAMRADGGFAEVVVMSDAWHLQYGDTVLFTWDELDIHEEPWLVVQVTHTTDPVRPIVLRRHNRDRFRALVKRETKDGNMVHPSLYFRSVRVVLGP